MDSPPRSYSLKGDLTAAIKFLLVVLWITIPIWIVTLRLLPPKFAVEIRDATGLDAPPPPTNNDDGPISTAFNITLHAANRRPGDTCYSNGEATVRYSGYTVAWGRTPAFCVGTSKGMRVVAWADGVSLPRSVRGRMAADWAAGAVDLEVDVRLFRDDGGSGRPVWLSCQVKAGGAKPPGATWCTKFALKNRALDAAPRLSPLMQYISNNIA